MFSGRASALLVFPLLAGCFGPPADGDDVAADDTAGETSGDSGGSEGVTWFNAVQPIIAENCWGCHFTGTSLSWLDLESFESASTQAAYWVLKLDGDGNAPYIMPPFPPPDQDPTCTIPGKVKDDLRLSAQDIATVEAWIAAGTPAGNPETAAPFTPQRPFVLEGPNVLQYPGVDHEVPAETVNEDGIRDLDHTKCFSIGVNPDEPTLVTAIGVLEDLTNYGAVHHVIVGTDPYGCSYLGPGQDCPDRPEQGDRKDTEEQHADAFDGSFKECESDQITDTLLLYTYTPGGFPLYFPEGSAMEIPAGGRLTFTVHYHRNPTNYVDNSTLLLETTTEEPTYLAYMDRFGAASRRQAGWLYSQRRLPVGEQFQGLEVYGGWDEKLSELNEAGEYLLEAGDADYQAVWREDNDLPHDYRLWSVFPHGHYGMSSIRIALEHNDGSETCLASIDPFDFNWQLTYVYDLPYEELPVFRAPSFDEDLTIEDLGDQVVVDCHYDNTWENDRLAAALRYNGYDEPFDMVIGENAFDDMCVMHYGLLVPWDQRGDL